MATSAERYVAAQNGAVRLAVGDLAAVLARLDLRDGIAVRAALEAVWPDLVGKWGEVTATLAADRFEELTGLPATLVRAVDPERANARMRWALGPLFGDDGDAIARLELLLDELVKQPGRSTIIASARENNIRYARVPSGAETCNWCLMLASRGDVYASRAAAGGDGHKYHGGCDCHVEPVASDGDMERLRADGYDPDALYERYLQTRA